MKGLLRAQTGPERKSGRHGRSDRSGGYDEHEKWSPFCYAKPTVERPLMACCSFCCALVFFLVILAGMLFGGVEVIRFSSDVPFYLYDHVSYKREVALLSAFDVADARLDGDLNERENAIDDFRLRVIYELGDADMLLSAEVLGGIKEMEEKIVAVAEYTKFCALNYDFNTNDPVCVRQDSVVNYFDPSWWVPTTTPPPEPTVPSEFNAKLALNQSKLASPDQDNYYAFADTQDTADASAIDLSQDNIDTVVQYWSGYCSEVTECPAAANGDVSPYALMMDGVNVTIASPISELMDTNFGIQDNDEVISSAQAMMSVFYFGSPQRKSSGELYDTDTDGLVDMRNELGEFLLDEVVDILKDGVQGVKVFWDGEGNGLLDIYVDGILLSDSSLLIVSILFIVVYLILALRSWWLGIVGMLMILGNFGPALIVYRIISGYNYFGTLNALSVFLVLGIGADDVFVFTNTWKHVRRIEPDLPVVEQLRHALSRGGKAMFVTSVTTAISFLMNAISEFPAVQSFGIFSAVLIMCNFFSVITLYPAAYMVYEYYFNDSKSKKNRCLATCSCCKKEKGYNATEGAAPQSGILVRFFDNKFYPFIHKFRIGILVVFAAVLVFYVYMGAQLEPESEGVSLLPDDDQYTIVRDKIDDYFSHSDISGRLTVQIPFGLVRSDRGDCGGEQCDPTIETDYGAPVWGDIDGISNEYTQKWFLDFCDAIETAEDSFDARRVYEADEVVGTPVKCPMEGFQTWCQQQDGVCEQTHPTLSTEEYVIDADLFHETFLTFLRDEVPVASDTVLEGRQTNLDIWEENVRFERTSTDSDVDPTLRYITVEVLLSEGFGLEFGDGITLYNDWGLFVETWVAKASTSEYDGADATVGDAFVTDNGGFQWFYLQRTIIQEAFTGIGLSLLGALVIVCLATSNWIISTLAIFVIAALVGGVVMFTVANGWDLGILEAVLFVMVVGFSVDYTLHLSDSYLESTKKTRGDRTRDMLVTMGPSVLSGAISTIGATFSLLFAVFVFFLKFGTVIFFIIAQSLIFSLFLFTTLLDVFGPEEPVWGENIKKGKVVLVSGASGDGTHQTENENRHLRVAKVTAVDTAAETCTVIFEGNNDNGHETSAGSKQTVALGSVRRRYQAGHIPAIDAGFDALGRFITKCCGCISCCFTTSEEGVDVRHGPKVVAGEDA